MTVTHTLRSFHLKIQRLVKNEVRKRDAWERVEKEYFEVTGKHRYKNYKSFRINHFNFFKNNNTI